MRYRLRTLLMVLALGPPVLAACWPLAAKLLTPPDDEPVVIVIVEGCCLPAPKKDLLPRE